MSGPSAAHSRPAPNARNSSANIPDPIWLQQAKQEKDPKVRAAQVITQMEASGKPNSWNDAVPSQITENIALIMESLARNDLEKDNARNQMDLLRSRAGKLAQARPRPNNTSRVFANPAQPAGGFVSGRGVTPAEAHAAAVAAAQDKKRTYEHLLATSTDEAAVQKAILENQPKRSKTNNIAQVKVPVDLPKLNPQPIQRMYEPHALYDQPDDWYMEMFANFYHEMEHFVTKVYGLHEIDHPTQWQPWACGLSPEFVTWAEQVAEPDPVSGGGDLKTGGWDDILRNTEKRVFTIMAILMRIIQSKIFDAELFGCTPSELALMNNLDTALQFREGFSRTSLRAETTRTIIGRNSVTQDFYPSVATLTAQISLLLHPLTSYLHAQIPANDTVIVPEVGEIYQHLHDLISNAAYLSLSIRLSPSIFYFVPIQPGEPYDPDDHLNFSIHAYTLSKETVNDKWIEADTEFQARVKPLKRIVRRMKKDGTLTSPEGMRAQSALVEEEKSRPANPGNTHRALLGISAWPVITRYKPGSDLDDTTLAPVAANLPDRDGMRIFQISKGGGIFYYGRENRPGNIGEGMPRLRNHVKEKEKNGGVKNAWKKKVNVGEKGEWSSASKVVGSIGVGGLAGLAIMGQLFGGEVVTEGIMLGGKLIVDALNVPWV